MYKRRTSSRISHSLFSLPRQHHAWGVAPLPPLCSGLATFSLSLSSYARATAYSERGEALALCSRARCCSGSLPCARPQRRSLSSRLGIARACLHIKLNHVRSATVAARVLIIYLCMSDTCAAQKKEECAIEFPSTSIYVRLSRELRLIFDPREQSVGCFFVSFKLLLRSDWWCKFFPMIFNGICASPIVDACLFNHCCLIAFAIPSCTTAARLYRFWVRSLRSYQREFIMKHFNVAGYIVLTYVLLHCRKSTTQNEYIVGAMYIWWKTCFQAWSYNYFPSIATTKI